MRHLTTEDTITSMPRKVVHLRKASQFKTVPVQNHNNHNLRNHLEELVIFSFTSLIVAQLQPDRAKPILTGFPVFLVNIADDVDEWSEDESVSEWDRMFSSHDR